MEIVVEIAYFVYVMGLSFDKVCLTLRFLQNLPFGQNAGRLLAETIVRCHWQHEFAGAVYAVGQLAGGA